MLEKRASLKTLPSSALEGFKGSKKVEGLKLEASD